MTWWFWAATLRHNELHEAYLLCKEARATAFARPFIEQACDLAVRTVGPGALRAEIDRATQERFDRRSTGTDLYREVCRQEATLEAMERVRDDRIGAVADWSMTALAQACEAFETGGDEPREPSVQDIIEESNKVVGVIVAIGWERNT